MRYYAWGAIQVGSDNRGPLSSAWWCTWPRPSDGSDIHVYVSIFSVFVLFLFGAITRILKALYTILSIQCFAHSAQYFPLEFFCRPLRSRGALPLPHEIADDAPPCLLTLATRFEARDASFFRTLRPVHAGVASHRLATMVEAKVLRNTRRSTLNSGITTQ